MCRIRKLSGIEFKGVTYMARVRGIYSHLLINANYDGIHIVDPVAQVIIGSIEYPYLNIDVEEPFSIYAWIVEPEGSLAYAFDQGDVDYAVEFDLNAGSSRRIKIPDQFGIPTQIGWFDPFFYTTDTNKSFWKIEGSSFVKADQEFIEQHLTVEILRILNEYSTIKMEANGQGYYVVRKLGKSEIGYISSDGKSRLLVPWIPKVIDVCHYGESVFFALEERIVESNQGEVRTIIEADEKEYFMRVNIIQSGNNLLLTVLSSSKDHIAGCTGRIDVYELANG